ncbi:MAG: hypothetical protein ACMG57_03840, partial [Candidatus Dojkabacteria bacterium]
FNEDWRPADMPALPTFAEKEGPYRQVSGYLDGMTFDLSKVTPGENFKVTCQVEYEDVIKQEVSQFAMLNVEYSFVNYTVNDEGKIFATLYFSQVVEA